MFLVEVDVGEHDEYIERRHEALLLSSFFRALMCVARLVVLHFNH